MASFTSRERVGVMAGVMLTLLLAALDQTVVGTAMPRIILDLHGFARYPWVTTAYMLASTLAVPIVGKLSDMYGRKGFFMGGAFVFVAASALCGAAGDLPLPLDGMSQLILFRGLQGAGGGTIVALSFVIVADVFPPSQRGRWQGLLGAVYGLASIVGPSLGGWITGHYSWRWVFYVNAPLGVLALIVLWAAFPRAETDGRRHVVDVVGIGALAAGLVPLLTALTLVGRDGWGSPQVVVLLGVAVAMLTLFVVLERRASEPVIPPSLFGDRIFCVAVSSVFCTGAAMFSVIMYVPLYLQGVLEVTPELSGQLFMPLMGMAVLSSAAAGQIASRSGRYREVAMSGACLVFGGMLMLTRLDVTSSHAYVVACMVVSGLGLGAAQPIYTLIVQNTSPQRDLGAATAAIQFFRTVGATVGVATFGTVMLMQYTARFRPALDEVPTALQAAFEDPLTLSRSHDMLAAAFAQAPARLDALMLDARAALAWGLHMVFVLGAGLMVVVLVLNLFMPRIDVRDRD